LTLTPLKMLLGFEITDEDDHFKDVISINHFIFIADIRKKVRSANRLV
jgi:hypothetical protein